MKTKFTFRKSLFLVTLLFSLFLIIKPGEVQAEHYRAGSLSWAPVGAAPTSTIGFKLKCFLSRDHYGYPAVGDIIFEGSGGTSLFFGDNTGTSALYFLVIGTDAATDGLVGIALDPNSLFAELDTIIDHVYPSSDDVDNGNVPWVAGINSCCRTGIDVNNYDSYALYTRVEGNTGNSSSTSLIPFVVDVTQSAGTSFSALASDVDGSGIASYALATFGESGITQPAGLTVDGSTGLVSWNTEAVAPGYYTCQIVITDGGSVPATAPVEFLIHVLCSSGVDNDDDGVANCDGDCDDGDDAVYPGASEICDGKDNNCNSIVDEGYDYDGDGYSTCAGDCDDDPYTGWYSYPGAYEECYDGYDNNCDGADDDNDDDGWLFCEECNDGDASINPGATEICGDFVDNDCDFVADEGCALTLANDNCSDAILITCASSPVSGSTIGAAADTYEDCGAGFFGVEYGVWYSYAGNDQSVTITTCDPSGIGYDTRLTVYSGSCGSFTCVRGNDDMEPSCDWGFNRSQVTFNAYSGTTYYIFVHGYNGATGDFVLNMTCGALCAPLAANETCATAESIPAATTCSPTTVNNSCSDAGVSAPEGVGNIYFTYPDLWFSFTAPISGLVTLTLTEGSASHLGYALYTECNAGFSYSYSYDVTSGAPYDIVALTGGSTYYLRLYTAEAHRGTFDYCLKETGGGCFDDDGDGVTTCDGDCDDNNTAVYPGAAELCFDGVTDNDCDGFTDNNESDDDGDGYTECGGDCDDVEFTFADNDGDGFGDFWNIVPCGTYDYSDCDDANWTFADYDGDGFGDGLNLVPCGTYDFSDCDDVNYTFADNDGDGFGDGWNSVPCGTYDYSDCDDFNWTFADYDGDGFGDYWNLVPCGTYDFSDCDDVNYTFADNDGDGFGDYWNIVPCGSSDYSDCDDNDGSNYPGNTEVCDYADNDCDGYLGGDEIDNDGDYYSECDGDCDDYNWTFADYDGDAFGDPWNLVPCGTYDASDCDDANWTFADNDGDNFGNPGNLEPCGIYDASDCDDLNWTFADIDGDGFGDPWNLVACGTYDASDCDDVNWTFADIDGDNFGDPGNLEPCGIYDASDCDDLNWTFADIDGDGFGDPWNLVACGTYDASDCDDLNWTFADSDGDGFGDQYGFLVACGVTNNADCDDFYSLAYPDADQICDGYLDNNCDYVADANEEDFDKDAYSICDGDCDDTEDDVYPGAIEVCNGIDDNCDEVIDEGFVAPEFIAPTPTCGETIYIGVGVAKSFTVRASDADAGDNVTLNVSGMPAGATLAPALPVGGNPVGTIFSWTPLAVDLGVHVVTFTATDNCGKETSCAFPVEVYNCIATVDAGADAVSYFGYAPQQTVTRTALPSGGPNGVYTYSWSLSRDLKCNILSNQGDESFSGGSCTDNTCPGTGSPASAAPYPTCSGSATISAALLAPATVCVTITDAGGCTDDDCFLIDAIDVRCFAGNSGPKKVTVCHRTGSTTNPWVQLCVDKNSVQKLLRSSPGDYLGPCTGGAKTDETGIENVAESTGEFQMNVYPNPSDNILNVEFETADEADYQLMVFDNLGRKVVNREGMAFGDMNKIAVPVNELAPGVYYLTLNVGDQLSSVKIVVTH